MLVTLPVATARDGKVRLRMSLRRGNGEPENVDLPEICRTLARTSRGEGNALSSLESSLSPQNPQLVQSALSAHVAT
jgi:hypothetical protein